MKQLKNIVTAIAALVLFTTTAAAQQNKATETLSVKYVGSEENYLVFQVEITGADAPYSFFKINDRAEGELYSQLVKTPFKKQTFKIEKLSGQELNFTLVVGNKVFAKSFTTVVNTIQETTVNENDVVKL
jgi:hypothetical protein